MILLIVFLLSLICVSYDILISKNFISIKTMSKEKEKKPGYALCLSLGMLFGVILGSAMGKLAVGIAIGYMFGTMYYLLFSKSDDNKD